MKYVFRYGKSFLLLFLLWLIVSLLFGTYEAAGDGFDDIGIPFVAHRAFSGKCWPPCPTTGVLWSGLFYDLSIVQKAVKLGFDFNSAANGEFVNIFTHLGENFFNHPVYNKYSEDLLANLKGLEGNDLMKGLNGVLDELRDVVKTAKTSGQTLDEVAKSR